MLNLSNTRVDKEIDQHEMYSLHAIYTPRSGRIVAYWLVGIFGFLFFCLFLPWQQNINGTGTVTALAPEDRPQTVQSAIAGRIINWKVREGQFVSAGDTILTLAEVKDEYFDPELLTRIQEQVSAKQGAILATETKIQALDQQIQALEESLGFSLSKARNKLEQARLKVYSDSADFEAEKVQLEIYKRQFAGYENLYANGLVSLTDYEKRRQALQQSTAKLVSVENKLLASRNELQNASIELSSLQAEYTEKISKARSDRSSTVAYLADAESEYSKLRNKFANVQVRTNQYNLVAPQDGYIVKALKAGIGETIKEGESVVTVMPNTPTLAVELYVRAMDVPLLDKGDQVRLEFDGWPALQFSGWPSVSVGTFGGIIEVIDYVNSQGGKYRILVSPDPNDEPWPEQLRIGSGVYGWAMLKEVPVWYEIWRQLNGFPPSLDAEPSKEVKEAKIEK
jgi:adhesin transport system membrane fusion protein